MVMRLLIPEESLAAFLACLGIGTLQAIRTGALRPEAGTWTLGPPRVWGPLVSRSAVPREIIEVFQTCDELAAMRQLLPETFDAEVGKLIERLERQLARIEDPVWTISWDTPAEGTS